MSSRCRRTVLVAVSMIAMTPACSGGEQGESSERPDVRAMDETTSTGVHIDVRRDPG
ncbi:MAG: hypothetical protein ACO225_13250 [Ilumatobacteraceae bacterium]